MVKSIVVNGRHYDTKTGLPLSDNSGEHVSHISRRTLRANQKLQQKSAVRSTPKTTTPAKAVHAKAQKSTTLSRKFTKKPVMSQKATPTIGADIQKKPAGVTLTPIRQSAKRIDGVRPASRAILNKTHRKLQPVATKPAPTSTHYNVAEKHVAHPIVKKVHQEQAVRKQRSIIANTPAVTPSASVLKTAAINEALSNAPQHHAKQYKHGLSKRAKITSAAFGCLGLMLFGGYLTYLNAPNLSVRVAAAQAGIDASYPGYHPDGYRLNGPVAFNKNQVSMKFVANADANKSYTLQQSRSNWDSSALLENYVKSQSGNDYAVSQEKGITVYSFDGQAAWVSGGILYTITGNANLSPDQARRIATSA